jgi:hypothetical protein
LIQLLRVLRAGRGVPVLWIIIVLLLEVLGRSTSSRWAELAGALVLTGMVGVTGFWHRRDPFAALTWCGQALRTRFEPILQLFRDLGIDFRERPPFPAQVPGFLFRCMATVGGLAGLLVVFAGSCPDRAFGVLRAVSFVLYLVGLVSLWCLLLAVGLVLAWMFLAVIHDEFVTRYEGHERRRVKPEIFCLAGAVVSVAICGTLLPPWVALVVMALLPLIVCTVLVWPGGPAATLIWTSGEGGSVRSFDYRWIPAAEAVACSGISITVALLAAGSDILGGTDASKMTATATATVGLVFLWVACAGLAGGAFLVAKSIVKGRYGDPALPCPPVLYVHGQLPPSLHGYLRGPLERAGWRVVGEPRKLKPTDVRIELVATAPDPRQAAPAWPKRVTLGDLEDPDCLRQLLRRDIVQKRRLLVRGLRRLFKRAARREFVCGEGYWIALQYWYSQGMTRDVEEEDLDLEEGGAITEIVGPPFDRVFSRAVRHHYAQIMAAAELDLVFVEDGVGFRGLERVLRILFEVYDVHGGRQRVEERHFIGLRRIRVVIHDYGVSNPYKSDVYPEPGYEEIGRARILHIFKDREEEPERVSPNLDITNLPVPVLGL